MGSIKSIIRRSKYSDEEVPAGWPPTPQDMNLRLKHTSQSVEYNIFDHAEDHLAEGLAQLGKLYEVDRGKAQEYAQRICDWCDQWCKDFQQYKKQD